MVVVIISVVRMFSKEMFVIINIRKKLSIKSSFSIVVFYKDGIVWWYGVYWVWLGKLL